MSLTLEQLDNLEIQILELLEAEDYDQAEKLLDSFSYMRETKVEGYAYVINKLNARAQWRRDEVQRLRSRADIDQKQSDWLKQKLQDYFEKRQIKTLETDRYRITLAKNGGKAPLVITAETVDLPEEYTLTEITLKPDKEGIREALEQGQELPFAYLEERGSSIRIK
jgi:hypothetical protein